MGRANAARSRSTNSVTAGLGGRIRALRLERRLSLRTVAATAQISSSLLSQIERGEASPSLVSLVAIADALVVRPGVLLDDQLDDGEGGSPVVRRADRRVIEDAMCRREYLMHLDDPYLEVAELIIEPGGHTRPHLANHSGRDYGVVITGQVVVEFEGRSETLAKGDYIAFDADVAHRTVNVSKTPARVLWIIAHDRSEAGAQRRSGVADG